MYRNYFGIDENPFSITPDPRYLYMSEKHQEALAHLLYGVGEGGGFVLLTGEVGTGKTTICRCLLDQLPDNVDAALCVNPRMSETELLANVCDELGIAYPRGTDSLKTLVDALNRHLIEAHAKGRRSVLIIDEAQNLSPGVLEQVRLLTNLETEKHKLLQIILIGQPELNDLLGRRELRQLAQRITARYHLGSLTRRETVGLIRHRLTVGGLDIELFDAGALAAIHKLSGGTPRLINSICDRCLLGAFARNRRSVDKRLVRAAAAEVMGQFKRKPAAGSRYLPWASAAAFAAAAAALFVTLGPFELDRIALLAPSQAVLTESPVAAATPTGLTKEMPTDRPVHELDTKEVEDRPTPAVDAPADAPPAPESAIVSATDAKDPSGGMTDETATKNEQVSAQAPRETPAPATVTESAEATPPAVETAILENDTADVTAALDIEKALPLQTEADPMLQTLAMVPVDVAAEPVKASQFDAGKVSIKAPAIVASVDPDEAEEMPVPETLEGLFRRSEIYAGLEHALATLFDRWNLDYVTLKGFAPCSKADEAGLQCLQSKGDWRSLQRLNRPALITLTLAGGTRIHAVVSAFRDGNVTLLLGPHEIVTSANELATLWSGGYLALWKPPATYKRQLMEGMTGPDVAWLQGRLAEIDGSAQEAGATSTFDATLKDKVMAFQRKQGLKADGIVGPRTVIHLNITARAPAEPVLRQPDS